MSVAIDRVADLAFAARVSLQSRRVLSVVLPMLLALVQLLVPSAAVIRGSVLGRRL